MKDIIDKAFDEQNGTNVNLYFKNLSDVDLQYALTKKTQKIEELNIGTKFE